MASLMLLVIQANAANFFTKKFEGWHWYERKRQEELTLTPEQEFDVMKTQSNQALHSAILNPTTENVLNYWSYKKDYLPRATTLLINTGKLCS